MPDDPAPTAEHSASRSSRPLAWMAVIAIAVGIVEPFAEVAWKCRSGFETSEACVWGRSYLQLGRIVGLVVIAPVAFGVLYFVHRVWRTRAGRQG